MNLPAAIDCAASLHPEARALALCKGPGIAYNYSQVLHEAEWSLGAAIVSAIFFAAAFVVVVRIAFLWVRLRFRLDRGACAACGYSLAGLPAESGCPECGHPRTST